MINTQDLCQSVRIDSGELHILRDINLTINAGESVAIVGASGSGKTTLLGMLAGLDVPSSGTVILNEHKLSDMSEEQRSELRRTQVAFVFQNFQLLESLTALENIMLPLEVRSAGEPEKKAREFIERVGLSSRAKHYPRQLSGGEQQRVALARAFACEAPIIFADEPTGSLDTETGMLISDLLFELNNERGTTLVLVTHSPELADRCQRRLTMQAGRIVEASDLD